MTEKKPFEGILRTYERSAQCIQTHFSNLLATKDSVKTDPQKPLLSLSHKPIKEDSYITQQQLPSFPISPPETEPAKPVSKEELGRATWTLLHTLGAQFPDFPTKQQKRDVKELMAILSRIYPCKECADHFKEVLKENPVQAGSQAEFSQWLCHVHNVVNRSLGKVIFPCNRVDARWGKLDCKERACDLQGTSTGFNA